MKLLTQLYSIHSMSGQEGAMRKFVKSYVKSLPGHITCRQDHGNLYITKGDADAYPCLVAHLDQVQTNHSRDFRVMEHDGFLFGFSVLNRRLEGLGADDKNGIWIALKCLEVFPALKIAFFKEEEIGCGGSRVADMSFFKDCMYCIQADRRNGGDLITDISGTKLCSNEFLADLLPIAGRHGYKETYGLMTDVETLVDKGVGISCINISCGYYDPHTDKESTCIAHLNNALNFVKSIILGLRKRYEHVPPVRTTIIPTAHYNGWQGWGFHYGDFNRKYFLNEPDIPNVKRYDKVEEWLEDAIWFNCEDFSENEIWAAVSADCDTYGISEADFLKVYERIVGEVMDDADIAYAG